MNIQLVRVCFLICILIYSSTFAYASDFLGANVEDRGVPTSAWRAGLKGVMPIVDNVPHGTLASQVGLQARDVIIKVGESLAGRSQYLIGLTKSANNLTVLRGMERITLPLNLPSTTVPHTTSNNKSDRTPQKPTTKPEVFVQLGHSDAVNSVAISPDGRYALSGSSDKTAKLWEINTGKEIGTLSFPFPVKNVVFSPNGRNALIEPGRLETPMELWDPYTGNLIRQFKVPISSHMEANAAFSPDGRYVIALNFNRLLLFDVGSGILVRDFEESHTELVRALAFSPDGRYVASAGSSKGKDVDIRLWDVTTGKVIRRFSSHDINLEEFTSLTFSSDGKKLLSGGEGGLFGGLAVMWDVMSGKALWQNYNHPASVVSVHFMPDGKVPITIDSSANMMFHNPLDGAVIKDFNNKSFGSFFSSVALPDGKLALGILQKDKKAGTDLSLVDIKTGNIIRSFEKSHTEMIVAFAVSNDSKYAASGSGVEGKDTDIRLWEIATGSVIRRFSGHKNVIASLAFSPDGKTLLSCGSNNLIIQWDVNSGKEIWRSNIDQTVINVTFTPDGLQALVTDIEGNSTNYDISSHPPVKVLQETQKQSVNFGIDFGVLSSDASKYISTQRFRTIRPDVTVWDVTTGEPLRKLSGDTAPVYSFSFSSIDSNLLAGPVSWNLKTGEPRIIKIKTGHRSKSIFTTDGKQIVAFDYGSPVDPASLAIYGVAAGKLERNFKIPQVDNNSHFNISLDGRYLAYISEESNEILILDVATGKIQNRLAGIIGYVSDVTFSPDGKKLLAGGLTRLGNKDGKSDDEIALMRKQGKLIENEYHIIQWDVNSGKEVWRKKSSYFGSTTVAYSPDGRFVFVAGIFNAGIVYDAASGRNLGKTFGQSSAASFSPDSRYLLTSGDESVRLWHLESGKEIKRFEGGSADVKVVSFSPDQKYVLMGGADGTTRVWDIASGKEVVSMITFNDGEWITITPEGYFTASPKGAQHLNLRIGNNAYVIDQLYSTLYRPDLVQAKMSGKDISAYALSNNIEKILAGGLAPNVHFLTKSGSADNYDTSIRALVCDTGCGIGDVTLFLNDMPVAVETGGRGLKVVEKNRDGQCYSFERTITLTPGANSIQLMAYNKANTIESHRDTIEINHTAKAAQPELHLLTVAVNAYRDGDLLLKYALHDADALAEQVQAKGKGLFNKVHLHTLRDGDVTKEGLAQKFASIGSKMKREDVFLLFVAGHGITDEKEGAYYFLPADFRYTGEGAVQKQAVSMTDFRNMLANVQAMKSLILLDTCNSGSFAEAIASRGMTEKTAITKLSRAVGRATIVASSKSQVALEGYEGHGAFTWTILEGMKGKTADKGSKITINTLATFIEEELPKLTFKKWGYEQIPQKTLQGMDFQIGVR